MKCKIITLRIGVFVKYENQFVGYGQIVINDSLPLIVNFGILENIGEKA